MPLLHEDLAERCLKIPFICASQPIFYRSFDQCVEISLFLVSVNQNSATLLVIPLEFLLSENGFKLLLKLRVCITASFK